MNVQVSETRLDQIRPWRDRYRQEMDCQIIHDSIHDRPGWTQEYGLRVDGEPMGYGSVAVGGPWRDDPALYEVYVDGAYRSALPEIFRALLEASGAAAIEIQSNDPLGAAMLDALASDVQTESILFHDARETSFAPPGAAFRSPEPGEVPGFPAERRRWHGVVEVDGQIAATGGILFHYNPPYGDVFMDVAEPFRRRGLGAFLVQELKRVCYDGGYIPGARCRLGNEASHRTLLKAGFEECGRILTGRVG